jgi:hypothetical protein
MLNGGKEDGSHTGNDALDNSRHAVFHFLSRSNSTSYINGTLAVGSQRYGFLAFAVLDSVSSTCLAEAAWQNEFSGKGVPRRPFTAMIRFE